MRNLRGFRDIAQLLEFHLPVSAVTTMLFRRYCYPLKKVLSLHLNHPKYNVASQLPWMFCCSFRTSPNAPLQATSGPCCARSCRGSWHTPVPREGAWQPISTTPFASPTPHFWSRLPRSSGPSSPRWVPGTFPGACSWELWQFTRIRQGLGATTRPLTGRSFSSLYLSASRAQWGWVNSHAWG